MLIILTFRSGPNLRIIHIIEKNARGLFERHSKTRTSLYSCGYCTYVLVSVKSEFNSIFGCFLFGPCNGTDKIITYIGLYILK
jgi:hypothetical protein